jgi:uncharacterized membrane protein
MFSPLVSIWSGALVLTLCVTGAVVLAFTSVGAEIISGEKRQWMALIFGIYALFRGVRISQTIKKIKENEKNHH